MRMLMWKSSDGQVTAVTCPVRGTRSNVLTADLVATEGLAQHSHTAVGTILALFFGFEYIDCALALIVLVLACC